MEARGTGPGPVFRPDGMVQVEPVPDVQPQCNVSLEDRPKPYIDVMENVFGGVRISPHNEPRARAFQPDLRRRPWLTGVTMSAVHVRLAEDDEDDRDF